MDSKKDALGKLTRAYIEAVNSDGKLNQELRQSAKANIERLEETFKLIHFKVQSARLLRGAGIMEVLENEIARRLETSMADLSTTALNDIADTISRSSTNVAKSIESLKVQAGVNRKQKSALDALKKSPGADTDDTKLLLLVRSELDRVIKNGAGASDVERMVKLDRMLRGRETGEETGDVNIFIESDSEGKDG